MIGPVWRTADVAAVHDLWHAGVRNKSEIARRLGWTEQRVRRCLKTNPPDAALTPAPNDAMDALLGVRRDAQAGGKREVEAVALGQITTVDEAAAAARIDLTAWRVVALETRHYPVQSIDGTQQGTYIKLRCEPQDGPSLAEQVEALVDGALAAREHRPPVVARRATLREAAGTLGLVVIADPHFGKLCWHGSTGSQNWNLTIARDTVLASVEWLVGRLPPIERIVLATLGDVFHYDTLAGTTTGGTMMDRDSRVAKVIGTGTQTVCEAVQIAAAKAPVDVLTVPGNHDAVLTVALQRVLVAEFRSDANVTVDETFTRRKPFVWGRTLLQFDHGDKARKKLARLLPQEYPELWGASTYREIHTGHLHTESESDQGVIVRTHDALCPPDQWHYDEGFTGSVQSASAFVYRAEGALEQMLRFNPRVHMAQEGA